MTYPEHRYLENSGYEVHQRGNGSLWYLCDKCESIAFLCGTEERMLEHIREKHLTLEKEGSLK